MVRESEGLRERKVGIEEVPDVYNREGRKKEKEKKETAKSSVKRKMPKRK